jgi:pimeloyl-ACP methyl ester carboxylesterase
MIERSAVTVNGLHTSQVILGSLDKPPIVMLHGWGSNSELMLPLAQRLTDFCIYVPDLPGFGATPPPTSAWSVFDYAHFVLAYLDAHHLQNVFLFGHSFGGRLGLLLGADHPRRVIKMALANSAGIRPQPSQRGQTRLKTYRFVQSTLLRLGMGAQADQLRNWYVNRYGSPDYKAAQGVMREILVGVVNTDLLPYAARVQVPTLLLWGDEDQDTPLWYGQTLEKTIPDAGLVVFKGAGHYSYLDKPAETARVVDYFFKQPL